MKLSRTRLHALRAVLALVYAAGAAAAGDYHVGVALLCGDCHVMHFSQQHGYDPAGALGFVALGPSPNENLLRSSINDLCVSCHDGSGLAADVLGAVNTGSQPGVVRNAGHLGRLGMVGSEGDGHTLDSLSEAPGSQPGWSPPDENGAGVGLTCVNCHSPHGYAGFGHPTGSQYRNLRSDPGDGSALWVTTNDVPGVNDFSRDVFVRQALDYDESAVDWNEPDSNDSALARWCGGCHSFAHDEDIGGVGGSPPPGGGLLDKHPVFAKNFGIDEIGQFNSHVNNVKVMSEVAAWGPVGMDVTPSCMSCHKSHGNSNPDGLIYRSGSGALTEDGDTLGTSVEDLCGQCHVGGSSGP